MLSLKVGRPRGYLAVSLVVYLALIQAAHAGGTGVVRRLCRLALTPTPVALRRDLVAAILRYNVSAPQSDPLIFLGALAEVLRRPPPANLLFKGAAAAEVREAEEMMNRSHRKWKVRIRTDAKPGDGTRPPRPGRNAEVLNTALRGTGLLVGRLVAYADAVDRGENLTDEAYRLNRVSDLSVSLRLRIFWAIDRHLASGDRSDGNRTRFADWGTRLALLLRDPTFVAMLRTYRTEVVDRRSDRRAAVMRLLDFLQPRVRAEFEADPADRAFLHLMNTSISAFRIRAESRVD